MAKEKKEKDQGEGKKPNIIVIALIGVVLIAGAVGGTYLFMKDKVTKKAIVETKVAVCTDLTVNLSDTDAERYLKTTVDISYDESNSDLADEITAKTVEIQDATSFYLRSKTSKDFDADNEETIKSELKSKIDKLLTKGKLVNVYFPNGLLVQ